MQTSAIRGAQLKLALIGLIERADEREVRDLCLCVLERRPPSVIEAAEWGPVAEALDGLAGTLHRELIEGLERAADHAGFLAKIAARQGSAFRVQE